jgi:predicted nucleotidyltransferase
VAVAAPVWSEPAPLRLEGFGPGLEAELLRDALEALAEDPTTKALVLFGSRARGDATPSSDLDLLLLCRGWLDPAARRDLERQARRRLGILPVDLDLLVEDESRAATLAGSRWHVLGRIAREGKVLYAS